MLPEPSPQPPHSSRLRIRAWRSRVGLGFVACLSVLAGMTDAIGFLATGDYVSFMSGNTTRLAVAISEANVSIIVRLSLAVLAFVLGNALGIVLARWGGAPRVTVDADRLGAAVCGCPVSLQLEHTDSAGGGSCNGHAECGGGAGEWSIRGVDVCDRCAVALWARPGPLAAGRTAQRLACATGALGRHVAGGGVRGFAACQVRPAGSAVQCGARRCVGRVVTDHSAPLAA